MSGELSLNNKINLKKSTLFLSSYYCHKPLCRENGIHLINCKFLLGCEPYKRRHYLKVFILSYWYLVSSWLVCPWNIFKLCQNISYHCYMLLLVSLGFSLWHLWKEQDIIFCFLWDRVSSSPGLKIHFVVRAGLEFLNPVCFPRVWLQA